MLLCTSILCIYFSVLVTSINDFREKEKPGAHHHTFVSDPHLAQHNPYHGRHKHTEPGVVEQRGEERAREHSERRAANVGAVASSFM